MVLRIRRRILEAYELEESASDLTWSDVDSIGPMNIVMNFLRTIPDPTRSSIESVLVSGVPAWWPAGKAPDTTLLERYRGKEIGDALEMLTKAESSVPRPKGVRLNANEKRFAAEMMALAGRARTERLLRAQLRPEKSLERKMLENLVDRRTAFHKQRLLAVAYSRNQSPEWDGADRIAFFIEIQERIDAEAAFCARKDVVGAPLLRHSQTGEVGAPIKALVCVLYLTLLPFYPAPPHTRPKRGKARHADYPGALMKDIADLLSAQFSACAGMNTNRVVAHVKILKDEADGGLEWTARYRMIPPLTDPKRGGTSKKRRKKDAPALSLVEYTAAALRIAGGENIRDVAKELGLSIEKIRHIVARKYNDTREP